MTASPNIKTPAMEVPLHRSSGAKVEGERLKKYFTRVTLDQVETSGRPLVRCQSVTLCAREFV